MTSAKCLDPLPHWKLVICRYMGPKAKRQQSCLICSHKGRRPAY